MPADTTSSADSDVPPGDSNASASQHGSQYVVVARRYRPQTFHDLVGQSQVSQALGNAITTHRVGHAYLFTGARGVGKTSTARIFAKALNCVDGPSPTPCNQCDICRGVSSGDDVDVLEIDGASNRGIDEIRQLRSNVNVRPSRARYKIYIIDEVHMLTTAAFNALLKTLEEPPEHVKFIFCTTDPEKIPITVLSRCQRFDFPPVEADAIVERLRQIVHSESAEADDEALRLLARRAAGSMRDSQSLLEQLLSFTAGRITVEHVHRMLGTANGGSLTALARLLVQRNAAESLAMVERAVREGVDVGQLAEQLVGYFRDVMAAAVGCPPELLLYHQPSDRDELAELGRQLGLETTLAVLQILDQAVIRMRQSIHVRTLLEMALVRICKLEDLDELGQLIARVQSGAPAATGPPQPARAEKKTTVDRVDSPTPAATPANSAAASSISPPTAMSASTGASMTSDASKSTGTFAAPGATPPPAVVGNQSAPVAARHDAATGHDAATRPDATFRRDAPAGRDVPAQHEPPEPPDMAADRDEPIGAGAAKLLLSSDNARAIWDQALDRLEDMSADYGRMCDRVTVAANDRLVVSFRHEYNLHKTSCERPERRAKIEQALAQVVGRVVRVDFEVMPATAKQAVRRPSSASRVQRLREVEKLPLVQEAKALFDAEILEVLEPRPNEGT